MALLWVNPATSNRFGNKHLLVVGNSPTLQQLIDEGRRVFTARVAAYNAFQRQGRKTAAEHALRDRFGTAHVSQNTLIVLSRAGLAALEASIRRNGYRSGAYDVRSGVIFNMTGTGANACSEALVASITLSIRPVPRVGHEVYHLAGAVLKAKLRSNVPASAYDQIRMTAAPGSPDTLGLKFTPTLGQLAAGKTALKPVTPNASHTPVPDATFTP